MAPLHESRQVYKEIARESEGQSGHQLAEKLRQRGAQLKTMQSDTSTRLKLVVPEAHSSQELQDEAGQTVERMSDADRLKYMRLVGVDEQAPASTEKIEAVADDLTEAAEDIDDTVGDATMAKLPEGVAGQANLERRGSKQVDPLSTQGQDRLVNREFATGVNVHETFHENQTAPNANAVSIDAAAQAIEYERFQAKVFDASPIPNDEFANHIESTSQTSDDVVDAHEFIEAGAIAAQIDAAPQSFDGLSSEYKTLYSKVTGMLDHNQVRDFSKEGDMVGFAQAVAEKRAA